MAILSIFSVFANFAASGMLMYVLVTYFNFEWSKAVSVTFALSWFIFSINFGIMAAAAWVSDIINLNGKSCGKS